MTETSQTERETGSTAERYVILSNPNQTAVIDTFTNAALFTYTGPNRLINALDRHMRLTERWEALQGGASLADLAETEDETVGTCFETNFLFPHKFNGEAFEGAGYDWEVCGCRAADPIHETAPTPADEADAAEEPAERWIVYRMGDSTKVQDEETGEIHSFSGPDQTERARLFANAMNAGDGRTTTPAEDMTVTQPIPSSARPLLPGRLNGAPHAAGASVKNLGPFDPREYGLPAAPRPDRATRLSAMLAQVIEVEARLWKLLAEDTRELNRAVSLRQRFERDIREAATALSATERAERSPLVPVSTPETFKPGEPVLWGSWNGPRPAKVVAGPAEPGGPYFVEVAPKRSHPYLGSFKGWIPAAELHHVS